MRAYSMQIGYYSVRLTLRHWARGPNARCPAAVVRLTEVASCFGVRLTVTDGGRWLWLLAVVVDFFVLFLLRAYMHISIHSLEGIAELRAIGQTCHFVLLLLEYRSPCGSVWLAGALHKQCDSE